MTLKLLGIKINFKWLPDIFQHVLKSIVFLLNSKECIMPEILTTKEVAKYLKLHEITICKYAAEGKIPAIRIGRVWRFDKEAIDRWISGGQKK